MKQSCVFRGQEQNLAQFPPLGPNLRDLSTSMHHNISEAIQEEKIPMGEYLFIGGYNTVVYLPKQMDVNTKLWEASTIDPRIRRSSSLSCRQVWSVIDTEGQNICEERTVYVLPA